MRSQLQATRQKPPPQYSKVACQVISWVSKMVARDGLEPPTPAFSGPDSPVVNILKSRHLPEIEPL